MENNKNYDLKILLKSKDLNIQKIAEKNGSMLIIEYFNSLTKFLNDSSNIIDGLNKFNKVARDKKFLQKLNDMKYLLNCISHDKLIQSIDIIIDAVEKGNKEDAANYAKKASIDFIELYYRIKASEKPTGTSVLNNEANPKLTLKKYIEQLDYEED